MLYHSTVIKHTGSSVFLGASNPASSPHVAKAFCTDGCMEDLKRGVLQTCNARRQILREGKPREVDSDQPYHASTECDDQGSGFLREARLPCSKDDRALQPDKATRRNMRGGARAPRMVKQPITATPPSKLLTSGLAIVP